MYTHTPKQPVGCSTYNDGWHTCQGCVFLHDPIGCDGFTAENGAKVVYED